jgi:hypothetical protein
MFNLKKHVSAADLSTRLSPEDIPGKTIKEKAAYISEYLDREIGEQLAAGEINIDAAYKLLAETKVTGLPQQFDFLEKYRSNISTLIQSACTIKEQLEQTGLDKNQVSEIIIKKLLERVNQVFIPELIELSRTGKRNTPEVTEILGRLPDYQDPDQISSIKTWISKEIQKEVNEIIEEYKEIRSRALRVPGLEDNDLAVMISNTPLEALKILFPERRKTSKNPLPSKFTDPNVIRDVEGVNDEIQRLVKKTNNKGENGWTRILALSKKLSEEEIARWKTLIDYPVEFNLYIIVKNAGLLSEAPSITPAVIKQSGFRNQELRNKYYSIFFPSFDPNNGLPFLSNSEIRYIDENFPGQDPKNIPYGADRRMDFIKRSQYRLKMNYAKNRLYEFIQDGYDGPGLGKLIHSDKLALDEAGLAIQYYFKNICKGEINTFLADLRDIGLLDLYQALSSETHPVDANYEPLRLTTRSSEEAKIIQILRDQFGIDAIPYQVLIPIPVDCPTNTNNFDIDFMIYVDVLEYVDPVTFKPVIKPKIMFVGEYFGYDSDSERTIVDRGKPWVDPDGNVFTPPAKISKQTGEIMKTYDPIVPGVKAREGNIYKLKTLWKKRTYATIAHIVGTDSLSFDEEDLKIPYNSIAQKLDEKDIIYSYPGCNSSNNFCKAKKMIENSVDFELKENLNNPEFNKMNVNDDVKKCIRAIDSAILHYKLQNGLKQAKQEFIGKAGFDRQTIKAHNDYFESIKTNIDNALKILASPNSSFEQKMSAQRMIEANQKDIATLENSPLRSFKTRFDEILSEDNHAGKIQQFINLRDNIEAKKIPADMYELRKLLLEIDGGIFGFVPDPEKT